MPFFSIILPMYNAELYIERCVASITSQDFSSYEIIIINDGSLDRSFEIVKRLAEANTKIKVFTQANSGVSRARNSGLRRACGKYILFIDVDDWILFGYLSFSYEKLKHGTLDGILLGHKTSDGKLIVNANNKLVNRSGTTIDSDVYSNLFLKGYISNSPCNKIFSKDLYDCFVDVFPASLSVGEDAVAMAKVGKQAKRIGLFSDCYLVYMQNTGGVTKTGVSKKKIEDITIAVGQLLDIIGTNYPPDLSQLMVFKQLIYYVFNGCYRDVISSPIYRIFCISAIKSNYDNVNGFKWQIILFSVKLLIKIKLFKFFLVCKGLVSN